MPRPNSCESSRTTPNWPTALPLPTDPWFAELGRAVASGVLTVAVADALRSGLGDPGGDADATLLAAAVPALIATARHLDADAARRTARQARDRIDAAGVAARAQSAAHDQFWRVWVKPDGMVRGEFELEPHDGMLVKAVFDQLTHPRRTDEQCPPVLRSPGRRRCGARRGACRTELGTQPRASPSSSAPERTSIPAALLDERKPSVRLVVNAHAVATGSGSGAIEGHPDRIPLADIHTGLCAGYLPIRFDDAGAVLDLGRDERLFTEKQKAGVGCSRRWVHGSRLHETAVLDRGPPHRPLAPRRRSHRPRRRDPALPARPPALSQRGVGGTS